MALRVWKRWGVQGYLAPKKPPFPLGPPWDPRHRLRQGPKRVRFHMSEVPLWCGCAGGVGGSGLATSTTPSRMTGVTLQSHPGRKSFRSSYTRVYPQAE